MIAQKLRQAVEELLATTCSQILSQVVREFLQQVVAESRPDRDHQLESAPSSESDFVPCCHFPGFGSLVLNPKSKSGPADRNPKCLP